MLRQPPVSLSNLWNYAIIAMLMDHEYWMHAALLEARAAADAGEIPVGAVVVWQGQIIGRGHNRKEECQDPTAHAEILALREAARARGGWRLFGATLYCTLEPCCMCAGALVNARIDGLVYAVRDPKTGAAGSVYDLVRSPWLNHRLIVISGVLAQEVQAMMQSFFQALRTD
jgi:tRNA(adenine34) deaminase